MLENDSLETRKRRDKFFAFVAAKAVFDASISQEGFSPAPVVVENQSTDDVVFLYGPATDEFTFFILGVLQTDIGRFRWRMFDGSDRAWILDTMYNAWKKHESFFEILPSAIRE